MSHGVRADLSHRKQTVLDLVLMNAIKACVNVCTWWTADASEAFRAKRVFMTQSSIAPSLLTNNGSMDGPGRQLPTIYIDLIELSPYVRSYVRESTSIFFLLLRELPAVE